MNRLKRNRIVLSYTNREWLFINQAIKNTGNNNGVISHIIKEVKKLNLDCQDITDENKINLTKIKKKDFYPPQDSIDLLDELSEKINTPRSTIVSRLIISPLLKEYLDSLNK